MMMETIGSRDTFAIEYEFVPDPHDGTSALPEEALSWGRFSIWVDGRNVCQHSYDDRVYDHVCWYLYPVLFWFAQNWSPLMYEEQPPVPSEKAVARTIFFEYAKQSFGFMSEKDGTAWYDWGQRHSLRSCSNGGLFPDLYIRAFGERIEFSWGNAEIPGAPTGFYFTASYDSKLVKRSKVVEVLHSFLEKATDHLFMEMPNSQKLQELIDMIKINCKYDKGQYLKWMSPAIRENVSRQSALCEKLRRFVDELSSDYVPAPILMYGSLSPSIQDSDIDSVVESIERCEENHPLSEFIKNVPVPNIHQHESGYDLALEFVDDFYTRHGKEADIESVLSKLKVKITKKKFSDTDMRGIAMAGKDVAPIIFINEDCHYNATENGERFTKAHELCHLLFDRQYGKEVGISSGPWASSGVEKRANAFAAMLLMPADSIEHELEKMDRDISFKCVLGIASSLRVSPTALIEHLFNLGAIELVKRDKLRNEDSVRISGECG